MRMQISAASLQYNKTTGLVLYLHKNKVKRDDEYKRYAISDNYTRFDVNIDLIRAELDMYRWLFDSRHPVAKCEMDGIRGSVDRTHLVSVPGWRMLYKKGEPTLDRGLVIRDALLAVRNASDAPAFPVSIYVAALPKLRWSWFLHDLLHASSIIGSYDNSLFTYQPPQLVDVPQQSVSALRHLRVDSLPIEHVNRGVQQGPLSWIQRGRMAIDIFVHLPSNTLEEVQGESNLKRLLRSLKIDKDNSLTGFLKAFKEKSPDSKLIYMNVNFKLSQVKAQVPLLTSDISLMNQALVRPTVAYLNEHRHYTLPLAFSFSLSVQDHLCGSWGINESGIADHLAVGVSESFSELVNDKHRAGERARRVGLWSLYHMLKQLAS